MSQNRGILKEIISEVPSFFRTKQDHLQRGMGNNCRPVQWEGAWRGCCGSEMQTQKESSQKPRVPCAWKGQLWVWIWRAKRNQREWKMREGGVEGQESWIGWKGVQHTQRREQWKSKKRGDFRFNLRELSFLSLPAGWGGSGLVQELWALRLNV